MINKWDAKLKDDIDPKIPAESKKIYLDVIAQQRKWLINRNNSDGHIDEDIIRKHLRQLDLEEEKFRII
jgi:CPA1 family monovalent cation:H+ antiporter